MILSIFAFFHNIKRNIRDYRLESHTMLFAKKRQDPFILTLSLSHPVALRWRKQEKEGNFSLAIEDRYDS